MPKVLFWVVTLGLGGIPTYAGHAIAASSATVEQADVRATAARAGAAASVVEEKPSLTILQRLEGTALAVWVNNSAIGYPTVLCLHVIGLAILVGTLIMLDLRLLNVVSGIPLSTHVAIIKFASVGFIVNVISGLALFVAQATTMATSVPFLTKITLVLLGAITTAVIHRRLRLNAGNWDDASAPDALRKLAVLSIIFWVSAIAAGRLVAYLNK